MAMIPLVFNLGWESNVVTLCAAIVVRIFLHEKPLMMLSVSFLLVFVQGWCLFIFVLFELFCKPIGNKRNKNILVLTKGKIDYYESIQLIISLTKR